MNDGGKGWMGHKNRGGVVIYYPEDNRGRRRSISILRAWTIKYANLSKLTKLLHDSYIFGKKSENSDVLNSLLQRAIPAL